MENAGIFHPGVADTVHTAEKHEDDVPDASCSTTNMTSCFVRGVHTAYNLSHDLVILQIQGLDASVRKIIYSHDAG